jgi:pimeloyl-ACP methyl ester carboxylesterase
MKWVKRIMLALVTLLLVGFVIFRTPDTDRQAMIAKYANADSKFLNTKGGRIHYRDQGPRDAPVLLLLHGANSSLQAWEPLAAALSGRYRMISLDMPGHGLTGPNKSRDYRAKPLIAAATQVLDAAGVKRATWVGNSWGGWIAWRAGLEVPERVNGLILISAAGAQTGEEVKPYLGARLSQSWLGRNIMQYVLPRSLVRKSLQQTMANPLNLSDSTVTRYWELLCFPGNRQAAADRATTDRGPNAWSHIGALHLPVLVIWGDNDHVIPMSSARAFKSEIANADLVVIEKAGHVAMEEQPKLVAQTIDDWMQMPKN